MKNPNPNSFYAPLEETPLKKALGNRIKPITSLINVIHPDSEAESTYLFMDHSQPQKTSSDSDKISFQLTRHHETVNLNYRSSGRIPKIIKGLLREEGKELALLLKAQKESPERYLLREVIKVYSPHP